MLAPGGTVLAPTNSVASLPSEPAYTNFSEPRSVGCAPWRACPMRLTCKRPATTLTSCSFSADSATIR
jgi:hypothetical protein